MTDLTIEIQSDELTRKLNQLGGAVTNMRPAMNAIGQVLKSKIDLCFRDTKSPDGINWQRLSPVTIARRRNNSDVPLNDTGILKNSFSVQAQAQSVLVGTNAKQAAMMNFGGKKARYPSLWGDIPARNFVPVNNLPSEWEEDIIDVIDTYLARAIRN